MAQPVPRAKLYWLDALLLSGVALAILFACALLAWMAWQAPSIAGALRPRATLLPLAWAPTSTPPEASPAAPTALPPATDTPLAPTLPPPTATPTPTPSPTPSPSPPPAAPSPVPPLEKTIVIDLSDQTLTALENARPVFSALVSTGQAYTPTPVGEFAIYAKLPSQTMTGPGYRLPNVQFVAYFYSAYAIHGTYWHDNFGHPMSHGCVNMRDIDAQWLYAWAPIGTPVSVRP
jgi:lipoprotein-anchoring transpeptidase ErfK/SrfK